MVVRRHGRPQSSCCCPSWNERQDSCVMRQRRIPTSPRASAGLPTTTKATPPMVQFFETHVITQHAVQETKEHTETRKRHGSLYGIMRKIYLHHCRIW